MKGSMPSTLSTITSKIRRQVFYKQKAQSFNQQGKSQMSSKIKQIHESTDKRDGIFKPPLDSINKHYIIKDNWNVSKGENVKNVGNIVGLLPSV